MEHRIDETCRYTEDFRIPDMNRMLEGRVVIVTGGSYGMGKKMAELLSEHGAKLFITARGQAKLDAAISEIREKTGGQVEGMAADSSNPAMCKALFAKAIEVFGHVDVLVNNAGKGELIAIDAVDDATVDQVVDTNLKGPVYLCREAINYFLPRGEGNIINISSVNGARPMCGAVYCATKGGLNALTKNVAIRCVNTGVRCNSVAPGHTPSPTAYAIDDGASQTVADGRMNEIRNQRTVRAVHPWEIDQAYAVLFLASDMSRCINGEIITVDCGCYL